MTSKIEIKKLFDEYVEQVQAREALERTACKIQTERRARISADILQDINAVAEAVLDAVNGKLATPLAFGVLLPEPIPTSEPMTETYVYVVQFGLPGYALPPDQEGNPDYDYWWLLNVKVTVSGESYALCFKHYTGRSYTGDATTVALAIAMDCWAECRDDERLVI